MCFLWLDSGSLYAQGPPIHTDTPITLGLQGRGVRLFSRGVRKARLLRDGGEVPDPMNRKVTAVAFPLVVPYNLTRDNVVGVVIPWVFKRLTSGAGTRTASGLGDLTVFMKQVVFQRDRRRATFRTALKGTLTLPTGDDGATPSLGNGAVDYSLGQVSAWLRKRTGLYLETLYTVTGRADGVDRGDRFRFNAALAYRLLPGVYRTYPARQLNAYIEFNGVREGRSGGPAEAVHRNSGGTTLLVSPGLQYIPSRGFLVEASLQYPALEELHGLQLGTSYVVDIGVRMLVF